MPSIKLTRFQAEEIEHRLHVRKDTVHDDPESGDRFENTPGALDRLLRKVTGLGANGGTLEVTAAERAWLREEVSNLADIASANSRRDFTGYGGWASSLSRLEAVLEEAQ
jgi:hypothetical protein